jgi:hypothetical protein
MTESEWEQSLSLALSTTRMKPLLIFVSHISYIMVASVDVPGENFLL